MDPLPASAFAPAVPARRLIEGLELAERGGSVRISMAHYNTPEEMERLIAALETALYGPSGHRVT